MATSKADSVEVTQADRDAAADWLFWEGIGPNYTPVIEAMSGGGLDDGSLILAFARHRITAEADKAELVDALRDARNMVVAWSLDELGADNAVQNVSRFDALIAKHGGEEK